MPDTFQIGRVIITSQQALIYATIAVGFMLVLLLSRMYWNKRLRQWAESEGLQLIRFRGARFYEGPSAWVRSRNQHLFLVTVRDKNGLERSCWIMFGTYWGFTWGEPITHVEWTDDL
jgi:hypothetical protein